MQFLYFFSFFTYFFVFTSAHEMNINEENDQFKKLPKNLVAYIGQYLEGKDFVNFSCSSKNINFILKKHNSIKENKEEIANIISETPLKNFSALAEKWKNKKINNVRMFLDILPQYEWVEYPTQKQAALNQINFETESKKFENYIKILNLLYASGYKKNAGRRFFKTYSIIQEHLSDEWARKYESFYIFNLENFALLNPSTRTTLAKKYQTGEIERSQKYNKGVIHFIKNSEKAEKYEGDFPFVLHINVPEILEMDDEE